MSVRSRARALVEETALSPFLCRPWGLSSGAYADRVHSQIRRGRRSPAFRPAMAPDKAIRLPPPLTGGAASARPSSPGLSRKPRPPTSTSAPRSRASCRPTRWPRSPVRRCCRACSSTAPRRGRGRRAVRCARTTGPRSPPATRSISGARTAPHSSAAQESAVATRFAKEVVVLSTVVAVGTAYLQVLVSQDRHPHRAPESRRLDPRARSDQAAALRPAPPHSSTSRSRRVWWRRCAPTFRCSTRRCARTSRSSRC